MVEATQAHDNPTGQLIQDTWWRLWLLSIVWSPCKLLPGFKLNFTAVCSAMSYGSNRDLASADVSVNLAQRHAHVRELLQSAHMHIRSADGPQALTCLLQAAEVLGGAQGGHNTAAHFRESFIAQAASAQTEDLTTAALLAEQLASMTLGGQVQLASAPGSRRAEHDAAASGATDGAAGMHIDNGSTLISDAGARAAPHRSDAHTLGTAEADARRSALQDSLQCPMCGGLVAKARWQQHVAHWCPAQAHQAGD